MSLLHRLLAPPVTSLANRFSSRPDKRRVDKALSDLRQAIIGGDERLGRVITFHPEKDKFVILSDQHKGARDGADVFALTEKNYLAALEHYYRSDFFYINLGDSEELWENLFVTVKRHNKATFQAEKKFLGELLEQSSRWQVEGPELRIFFPAEKRAFAELLEGRDALEKIRAAAGKVLGKPVRVCTKIESMAAAAAAGAMASSRSAPASAAQNRSQDASANADLRAQFENEPMVRAMLERFGGKISEVKPRPAES